MPTFAQRVWQDYTFTQRRYTVWLTCLLDVQGQRKPYMVFAGAATQSFIKLEPADIKLLDKIVRLTLQRPYSSEYLQVIQQVDWNSLSPFSQHDAFCEQVSSIMGQARLLEIFHEEPRLTCSLNTQGVSFLRDRALRSAAFRVDGFGADNFTAEHDIAYSARDQVFDRLRELRTCSTTRLVDERGL